MTTFDNLDQAEAFLKQNLSIILNVSPDQLNSFKIAQPQSINSPFADTSPLFIATQQSFVGNGGNNGVLTSPFSLVAYANFVKNQLAALDSPRGVGFIMSQTALHLLGGNLYNPLSFAGPPPFFGGATTDILNRPIADQTTPPQDKLTQLYQGTVVDINRGITDFNVDGPKTILFDGTTFDQKFKQLNIYTPDNSANNQKIFDPYDGTNIKIANDILNVPQNAPDYEKFFQNNKTGPGFLDSGKGFNGFSIKGQLSAEGASITKAKRVLSQLDVYVSKDDVENGFEDTSNNFNFNDDDTYIPFSFQDLRKPERMIFFKAFITQFEESLTPEWNTEQFYGRVDPVGVYKNTSRTFNVAFKIVSFSQAGFSTMWKKINNLSKMVLPQIKNGAFYASPVIRLRIGDVCCDVGGRGLPGYINSALNFNYSDATWETIPFIQQAANELGRAPMMADVSFSFQVIHEVNPTVDENYNFDTTYFRRIGTLNGDIQNANSVDQNQPNTSDQTSNSANQTTTINNGPSVPT